MARKDGKDRGVVFKKGKWWVRIYTNGREKWYRVDNKTQAKALHGRLIAEAREGRYFTKENPIPFRQLAMEYEEVTDANRRGRVGDDRSRIHRWIDAFGEQDTRTLTPDQVERVLLDLQKEGYKPATVDRHFTVLKAILNRKKGLEIVSADIRRQVKKPKYDNELVRFLTDEQETSLLAYLPDTFKPIVRIAINTGLRQAELLGLRWCDINWQTGMIAVAKTKTGERRRIPMNSTVQEILSNACIDPKPQERIFDHDARYLRRKFNQAVQDAGLAPFRFHDLRHCFASRLAMLGCNDRTIMELGGWATPRMLKRYAHIAPTHLWQAVEGLTQTGTGSKTGTSGGRATKSTLQLVEKIGAGKGI